jgi:hypothetical protein
MVDVIAVINQNGIKYGMNGYQPKRHKVWHERLSTKTA